MNMQEEAGQHLEVDPRCSLITAEGLIQHTLVLASDEFEGRLPASEGEIKTVDYLTRQFSALKCSPAGAISLIRCLDV